VFAQEITLFRFMHGYLQKLMAELTDADLRAVTPGAVNPPAYILGHLAISNDFALRLLGRPPVCPAEWAAAFGPGSSPEKMQIEYPSKAALLETIRLGHEAVIAAAPDADQRMMGKAQSFPLFKGTPIQTVGDCVALLMTTHFALHVGQLSLMRRQLGHAPLF
jgi:hypothetical protein